MCVCVCDMCVWVCGGGGGHMSNTPYLSRMDIPVVRLCPIDRWRNVTSYKYYKLHFALIMRVLDNPPHMCVQPCSKKESKRASFHSLFLHLSIGHDLTPGMSIPCVCVCVCVCVCGGGSCE